MNGFKQTLLSVSWHAFLILYDSCILPLADYGDLVYDGYCNTDWDVVKTLQTTQATDDYGV